MIVPVFRASQGQASCWELAWEIKQLTNQEGEKEPCRTAEHLAKSLTRGKTISFLQQEQGKQVMGLENGTEVTGAMPDQNCMEQF